MPTEPPCVLVVDDDPTLQQTLCAILESEGYATATAANGREAVALAREHPPALVLLDLQMPTMTGQEALAELRRLPEHIPVVFMTAGLRANLEAERHGADGYLEKPFELQHLLDLVGRLCV